MFIQADGMPSAWMDLSPRRKPLPGDGATMTEPPELLIISGPNGCGKTTLAVPLSERRGCRYLGADKIAASLSPADPAAAQYEAGRQFIEQMAAAIKHRESLVVETTLSGRTFARSVARARGAGFRVEIVHLFVDVAATCVGRVALRVQRGGHHVPEEDVRRRFERSAANFWQLYRPLCDRWELMYNALDAAVPVARGSSETVSVIEQPLFDLFLQMVESDV